MKFKTRILLFAILTALAISANRAFDTVISPDVATSMTIATVNDNSDDAAVLRSFQDHKDLAEIVSWTTIAMAFAICFLRPIKAIATRSTQDVR